MIFIAALAPAGRALSPIVVANELLLATGVERIFAQVIDRTTGARAAQGQALS